MRFDAVDGLEYSEDLLIFDLLRVRLLHGWLVDPQDTATAAAVGASASPLPAQARAPSHPADPGPLPSPPGIGSRSYNQLVERIIEAPERDGRPTPAPVHSPFRLVADPIAHTSERCRRAGRASASASRGCSTLPWGRPVPCGRPDPCGGRRGGGGGGLARDGR